MKVLFCHKAIQSRKAKVTSAIASNPLHTVSFSCSNQWARELTSSSFHRPSSYLYHLRSPSSFFVLWHIKQESCMHVKNLRNREAFSRIKGSISLRIRLDAGGGEMSIRRQCDIFRTSRWGRPSKIMSRASLRSIEHRRLKTFSFGRYATSVEAKKISQGPMIFSSLKFLQLFAISSMKYGGFAMLGIVKDSRSFQQEMALQIPVFFILFQAGKTSRFSFGHLQLRETTSNIASKS